MRLVIDTNIIVSALLSPDGAAFKVISDVLDGKYTVFMTRAIYKEYDDVLHRSKFGFNEDIIAYILGWFRANAVWIEPQESSEYMPDDNDRIFYNTAKCCKAKLLTGNVRHYPVDELVTQLWELQ